MPDQWDAYIDVIGEGKFVEEVEAIWVRCRVRFAIEPAAAKRRADMAA